MKVLQVPHLPRCQRVYVHQQGRECPVVRAQDKLLQKQHFTANGIAVAPFTGVASEADARAAGARFGYPFMLKACRCQVLLDCTGRGQLSRSTQLLTCRSSGHTCNVMVCCALAAMACEQSQCLNCS